jgi:hypothetical protein
MPRFVFITAESDINRVKPLGPPTESNNTGRDSFVRELQELSDHYNAPGKLILRRGGQSITSQTTRHWDAQLSPEVWNRYAKFEHEMMQDGLTADHPDLMTPTYDRLAKSGLKAAVILAAARQRPTTSAVEVTMTDLLKGIQYVEQWRMYTHEVLNNVGRGGLERELDKILNAVIRKPGISRSHLMQTYHLTARQADQMLETLDQRGRITRQRTGRTETLYPVGV